MLVLPLSACFSAVTLNRASLFLSPNDFLLNNNISRYQVDGAPAPPPHTMLAPKSLIWSYFRKSLPVTPVQLRHDNFSCSLLARSRPWTQEELDTLTRLKIEHKPTKEVAAALPGRTRVAVHSAWVRSAPRDEKGELLQFDPKYFTQKEITRLCLLRESGLTFQEISDDHFPDRNEKVLGHA